MCIDISFMIIYMYVYVYKYIYICIDGWEALTIIPILPVFDAKTITPKPREASHLSAPTASATLKPRWCLFREGRWGNAHLNI